MFAPPELPDADPFSLKTVLVSFLVNIIMILIVVTVLSATSQALARPTQIKTEQKPCAFVERSSLAGAVNP